jgi:hypothetical protein
MASKATTKEERYRRVLVAAYERILAADDLDIAADLGLLDAIKDCVTEDDANMTEWSVKRNGEIVWR